MEENNAKTSYVSVTLSLSFPCNCFRSHIMLWSQDSISDFFVQREEKAKQSVCTLAKTLSKPLRCSTLLVIATMDNICNLAKFYLQGQLCRLTTRFTKHQTICKQRLCNRALSLPSRLISSSSPLKTAALNY